ncbi:MAG: DUF1176 domain-containing protein [Zoogloeaceae bacterium]|jgi:hypothetical protein|nr:DUF1176 domain-containing protein [Zoogloeaceae bacterium]
MHPTGWTIALSLLTLCASLAATGEEQQGISFLHEDWEIVCDNTRTCRMAGYSSEGTDDGERGSVLITRTAGPNTPLEGEVTLGSYGIDVVAPSILTLWINGKSRGKLKDTGNYSLTPTQIQALLAAARSDRTIEFKGDSKSFTLSGKGVSAVMLKMDEFQGRIGTPGALIRKGEKPEESVLPPLPVPVIRAAKVSKAPSRALTWPEVKALKPLLWESEEEEFQTCNLHDSKSRGIEEFTEFTLTPLDERHVLISTPCWLAAYNWISMYWVMDSALKGVPKAVAVDGEYHEGEMRSAFKGRGLGDCWNGADWIWDGSGFRQSAEWHSGMCRLIHPGGTWRLPTLVTKIINKDETPY